jgi:hypothetical protein
MNTCEKCGKESPDEIEFCTACGTRFCAELHHLLAENRLENYFGVLRRNHILTPDELALLQESDFDELGILKVRDRARLQKTIQKLISKDSFGISTDGKNTGPGSLNPSLSITTENSEAETATSESIRNAVWDDNVRGAFLILEHTATDDLSPNDFYMQAGTLNGDEDSSEGFHLEYRDGSPAHHYGTEKPVMHAELEAALVKYAIGDESFKRDFVWCRLTV